jgi:hypothetical protein
MYTAPNAIAALVRDLPIARLACQQEISPAHENAIKIVSYHHSTAQVLNLAEL